MSLASDQRDGEQACLDDFRRAALAALAILASWVHGWRERILEEGAKAVFPHATVQRCIVHLIRNSIRYIPRKQWSAFTKQLKLIYGAINVKQARQEFEKFKTDWQAYPGAVTGKTISHTSSSSITMAVPCIMTDKNHQERRFPNEDSPQDFLPTHPRAL